MKLLVLIVFMLGCGAPEPRNSDERDVDTVPFVKDKEKKPKKHKKKKNKKIIIIIDNPDADTDTVDDVDDVEDVEDLEDIDGTEPVDEEEETPEDEEVEDGLEDSETHLPILYHICSGVVVYYDGNLYYIGEQAKKVKPSWTKVSETCRLRTVYGGVEQQEMIDDEWVIVE